ncbi:ABC transporter ATP-binding protein [Streptomyces inusitatus]|uniref:ABC transporter ATP-binding protein n=1 Tax=Streptomyces inusitatus TaxID=68221 RepID=A0A918PXF2_9ACTN|nr:ATP-binding cassette domain-containing protein [Streptomyces inusitatus]GGZ25357.1 ABC transporter ATP-binding protein [Streptomyces inusitatus]
MLTESGSVMPTVELDSVSYSYGRSRPAVLNSLSYSVPDGFTVLLGPNGAGKSTALRLACGLNQPRTGAVRLGELPSHDRRFLRRVAWMPQQITAMTGLTAREQVAYTGWLKGMSRSSAWEAAATALAKVQLRDQSDVKTRHLSGGQLRRVGVASALVHGAGTLLLDEPTAGMDPTQRRVFRDLVLRLATDDVRVLMSTHDIADLADEANHVTVLVNGRITYNGSADGFLAHAPEGSSEARRAEFAYTALTGSAEGTPLL